MQRLILFFLAAFIIDSCSSGKSALKKGDYYDAVLESIHRLRGSPDNKKAKQVLEQGYPLAIEYIETSIQNGITAEDPKKWRNAVKGYEQINYINDQIKTSLGAMKVIQKPVTRFNELAAAKKKAADESYEEGITELMKNTRENSKQAYYDFKDANSFEPGYRESIEMMTQAEFNATLRVAYEEINASRINYGSLQPVVNSLQRLFLSFKPVAQKDTVPPQQYLRIIYNGYQGSGSPAMTSSSENLSRQIKTGEKKGADGKVQDIMETVTAKITYYRRYKNTSSNAAFTITDVATNAVLQDEHVVGNANWQYDWATYSGDARALNSNQVNLTKRKEAFPNEQELFNQSMRNLENNLGSQLKSFYSRY